MMWMQARGYKLAMVLTMTGHCYLEYGVSIHVMWMQARGDEVQTSDG